MSDYHDDDACGHDHGDTAGRTGTSRRGLLLGGAGVGALALFPARVIAGTDAVDLAPVAVPTASTVGEDPRLLTLFDTKLPSASTDTLKGAWSSWPHRDMQWIDLRWSDPVTTSRIEVYWAVDGSEVILPRSARLLRWDGGKYVPVTLRTSPTLGKDMFDGFDFAPLSTDRLRLEVEPAAGKSAGVLRWRVLSAGALPSLAPAIAAGIDRSVVVGGKTYLSADARWVRRAPGDDLRWTKVSGPGNVSFADPAASDTLAGFSAPGDYVLRLTGNAGARNGASTLHVRAVAPPPAQRLDVVYTTPWSVDNPMWNARVKSLIVNWIPHCVAYCERTDLPTGQGGIDNFVEAAKALRGEPHGTHKGYVFSNAWIHQTVESMCLALMVDAAGDREIAQAQDTMRATLERWIPIILAAQESDGYLQTAFTLADRREWPRRWSPGQRANHEGYVAGYFLESAINHHTLTGGKDLRLYDAAKKLADCWVAHIGPGKQAWFDGHQEMEQALVRFGRFVNDVEGGRRGDAYVGLARFLLDSREGGSEYDQSHVPPVRQYEAVGHAVRAVYFYSGMADVAAETGDIDYQSAVMSLWDNMVNRKYYVTGGVGSGDTAEGFGVDYALKNDAYCESCSSCGLIFFQYKMSLAYHDARYADLLEETMYNALLGSVDITGKSFCYTNPLDGTERAKWHSCPCCVGNIPRTLLMAPTWAYAKATDALFVNLFIGSRVNVGKVAGTEVEMVQQTDYPWKEAVAITVNPAAPSRFAVHVRVPDRATSTLYTASPAVSGVKRLSVNGRSVPVVIENGYAVIHREWKAGDRISFDVPLAVQRIRPSDKIAETRGHEAFRYGPLVYAFESVDQASIDGHVAALPVATWQPDLLGGIVTLEGRWKDGAKLRAIPYYQRANRDGGPLRDFPIADGSVSYAPGGSLLAATAVVAEAPAQTARVWVRAAPS
ncbi:glycoside hydrolase family 127 protein [Sphingomonas sp. Leaf343]|uniref:glycoside hydrolase family 127 protein n=1 Tax=Sphingomonas sp. Leaf343 TaxID=1736345 RepID=UPI0009EC4564|nr:beta-L-arabinofuranosidase domain-containing protein [Sphingomonas sp. Leaf343]